MKEFIEEIWRKGKKIYNHKWRKLKSLQASHLNPKLSPMIFKLFKTPIIALEVCIFVFSSLPLNALSFSFYTMWKSVKTRSCIMSISGARPERAHGHRLGTERAQGAPTGTVWAPSAPKPRPWARFGHQSRFFNSHASFAPFIHPLDSFFLLYLSTSSYTR